MKTIKQIADQLGIDKQRVYRFIKKNRISEAHQTASNDTGVKHYDEAAETLIIQYFSKKNRISEVHPEAHQSVSNDTDNDTLIDMLKAELDIKNKQLETKDGQIKDLNNRLAETTQALLVAQQTTHQEQLLHGGTMQKQLSDGGADPENEPLKIGFWERIFGRKK